MSSNASGTEDDRVVDASVSAAPELSEDINGQSPQTGGAESRATSRVSEVRTTAGADNQPLEIETNQPPESDISPNDGLADVLRQLARLSDMFEDKMRYDQVKEEIIDKLHAELQQHRNDMLGRILLPVMRDLIHLHGALLKFVDARRGFAEDKRDWNNLLDNVATFGDDLTEILARNGVESFSEEGSVFSPRTQRALRTVPTQDKSAEKSIAERVRPGFRWGSQVIHNEEVIVYKFQQATAPSDNPEAVEKDI